MKKIRNIYSKPTHGSKKVLKKGNIKVEDWPVLPSECNTWHLESSREVSIGEQYTLCIEFQFYKGTPETIVFRNRNLINKFLLTLKDYSDIQYIYNKVSELLGLNDAIKECAEVLISYNEILDYVTAPMSMSVRDMQRYMLKADSYGVPREMMHYVDGKCVEIATTKHGWTVYHRWDEILYFLGLSSSVAINIKEMFCCTMWFGAIKDVLPINSSFNNSFPFEELFDMASQIIPLVDHSFVTKPRNLPKPKWPTVKKGDLVLEDRSVKNSLSWLLRIGKQYSLLVDFYFPEEAEIACNKKEEMKKFLLGLDDYTDVKHIYSKASEILGLTNAAEECEQVLISYNENMEHVSVPMAMPAYLIEDTIMEIGLYGVPRERLHYQYGRLVDFSCTGNGCTLSEYPNKVSSYLDDCRYISINKSSGFACYAYFGIANRITDVLSISQQDIYTSDNLIKWICRVLY